ncbi:MAG TPA: WD40 repeat domain-containing protein [Kofleriaceae bacterium]
MASSAEDKLVRLWDAATGAVVGQEEHRATVLDLRFAPSGELLATAGADETIGIWRVDTGRRVTLCEGHEAWVVSVAWSPQGHLLASVSNDATLRIWDAVSAAEIQRRELGTKPHAVAWSPSGERLAVGLDDGQVSVLDPGNAASPPVEELLYRADAAAVNCLEWSAEGRTLVTGGDKTVRISDARTGHVIQSFAFDEGYAWRLSWAPGGAFVVVSLRGDVVRLWDTRGALAAP